MSYLNRQDGIDTPLNGFEGIWSGAKSYAPGTIVQYGTSYYIAKTRTEAGVAPQEWMVARAAASKRDWQLFMAMPGGGYVNEGGGGGQPPITEVEVDAKDQVILLQAKAYAETQPGPTGPAGAPGPQG
jgi:hypothetical protein